VNAALVTAVYDSYDSLKPFALQDVGVDAVCVTDDPDLACEGWRVVYEPRLGVHPNRAAKAPKMCPWRYTTADCSVWVDASFRISSPTFVRDALGFADPIAQFVHWDRDCIYEEVLASVPLVKYLGEPLEQQIRDYQSRGHPTHWGLWATGLIARRHTGPMMMFGQSWLSECEHWSYQDQVSQPVVFREMGLRPETIPGTYSQNPWIVYEGSGRH